MNISLPAEFGVKGRYRLNLANNNQQTSFAADGALLALLAALERQFPVNGGAPCWEVAWELDAEAPGVVVTFDARARAKPAPAKRRVKRTHESLPMLLTLDAARKKLRKAKEALRGERRGLVCWNLKGHGKVEPVTPEQAREWLRARREQQRIGAGLRRVWKAVNRRVTGRGAVSTIPAKVYPVLDALYGYRVRRGSQTGAWYEDKPYSAYLLSLIRYTYTFRGERDPTPEERAKQTEKRTTERAEAWEAYRAALGEREYWKGVIEALEQRGSV